VNQAAGTVKSPAKNGQKKKNRFSAGKRRSHMENFYFPIFWSDQGCFLIRPKNRLGEKIGFLQENKDLSY
jgi:hypothetical protein